MDEKLMTIDNVTEYLQVLPDTVRKYIYSDKLTAIRLGGGKKPDLRVRRSDFEEFISRDVFKANTEK